jgi:hypothetical protein
MEGILLGGFPHFSNLRAAETVTARFIFRDKAELA